MKQRVAKSLEIAEKADRAEQTMAQRQARSGPAASAGPGGTASGSGHGSGPMIDGRTGAVVPEAPASGGGHPPGGRMTKDGRRFPTFAERMAALAELTSRNATIVPAIENGDKAND